MVPKALQAFNRWEPVLMQMADCVDQVLVLSEVRASAPPEDSASLRRRAGQSAGRTETSVLYCVYLIQHMSRSVIRSCLLSGSNSFESIVMGATIVKAV